MARCRVKLGTSMTSTAYCCAFMPTGLPSSFTVLMTLACATEGFPQICPAPTVSIAGLASICPSHDDALGLPGGAFGLSSLAGWTAEGGAGKQMSARAKGIVLEPVCRSICRDVGLRRVPCG